MPEPRGVHLCRFDTTGDLSPKNRRTYDAVKAAVLAAGCFSVFEASETPTSQRLFTRLCRDPELEILKEPAYAYPWTGVRRVLPDVQAVHPAHRGDDGGGI